MSDYVMFKDEYYLLVSNYCKSNTNNLVRKTGWILISLKRKKKKKSKNR